MPKDYCLESKMMTPRERILHGSLIDKGTGCWEWQLYRDRDGYGKITINGKPMMAHRVSYEEFQGEIKKGLYVCHKCDNPSCVNPNHLFLGTARDNNQDMIKKGRKPKFLGVQASRAIFTEQQVIDIRKRVSMGEPQRRIAFELDVHPMTINKIVHRKTWRHVK